METSLALATSDDHLYNPSDDMDTMEWMKAIGEHVQMVEPWVNFGTHIFQVTMADNIGLLRLARKNDIETARANAGVTVGYVNAIRKRLMEKGTPVSGYFNFTGADAVVAQEGDAEPKLQRPWGKKFQSQRERPALGAELGPETLANLTLPAHVLAGINLAPGAVMKSRGKNSTERVADEVYIWALGEWANLHVDEAFCERMHEILTRIYPKLKPWGANSATPRVRTWFEIIKNRFSNVRGVAPVRTLHTTPSPCPHMLAYALFA